MEIQDSRSNRVPLQEIPVGSVVHTNRRNFFLVSAGNVLVDLDDGEIRTDNNPDLPCSIVNARLIID